VKNEQKKLHKNSESGKVVKWFAYDAISFILSRDIPESMMDTENTINEVSSTLYCIFTFCLHSNTCLAMLTGLDDS
jgi:hypothetical protein